MSTVGEPNHLGKCSSPDVSNHALSQDWTFTEHVLMRKHNRPAVYTAWSICMQLEGGHQSTRVCTLGTRALSPMCRDAAQHWCVPQEPNMNWCKSNHQGDSNFAAKQEHQRIKAEHSPDACAECRGCCGQRDTVQDCSKLHHNPSVWESAKTHLVQLLATF